MYSGCSVCNLENYSYIKVLGNLNEKESDLWNTSVKLLYSILHLAFTHSAIQ
jgi:hypothetical protein